MNRIYILILFAFIPFSQLKSQSLSGNIKSLDMKENLSYANVNVYKKGKLVANLIADENGDFILKLDTGLYSCEILYAGHKKIVKEVRVLKDEKTDFGLKEDKTSKYKAVVSGSSSVSVSGSSISGTPKAVEVTKKEAGKKYSMSEDMKVISDTDESSSFYSRTSTPNPSKAVSRGGWGQTDTINESTSGKLTAGEINDFSKWKQWNDLSNGELSAMKDLWQFHPQGRITVQIQDQNKLPLSNVKVELRNKEEVVFRAITDNTGKAELWESLSAKPIPTAKKLSVHAVFGGKEKSISKPTYSEKGLNLFSFRSQCQNPEQVDIAMVIDATGSMSDEIEFLKKDLSNVVFQAKGISTKLDFRFANVFYRDLKDAYVTDIQNFTSVLSESTSFISSHFADGGGDGPEAVEIALDSAIHALKWRPETRTKILFLVLDAPPHNTLLIQERIKTLSTEAATMGIRIVPVAGSGIEKNTEYLMRCLAQITNGTYTFLTDHSGVGGTHLKPSTDSYQVELLNSLLVRTIKSYVYMPECNQSLPDLGINLPDSVVEIQQPASDSTGQPDVDTSKAQAKNSFRWKFFPNPTDGLINIECSQPVHELYITDLSGKVLHILKDLKANKEYEANLAQYPTGIYLIRYPMGKAWVSGKVVLRR